jgi:hypothetical protein
MRAATRERVISIGFLVSKAAAQSDQYSKTFSRDRGTSLFLAGSFHKASPGVAVTT